VEQKTNEPRETRIGADLILPILTGAFATYYLVTIADAPWEARVNGLLIASVLFVLISVFISRMLFAGRGGKITFSLENLLKPRDKLGQRFGFIGLTAASIYVMQWAGFTLTVWLFLLLSMLLLGVRDRWSLLGVSTGAASLGYGLFIVGLGTPLPVGPIEHLIKALS